MDQRSAHCLSLNTSRLIITNLASMSALVIMHELTARPVSSLIASA
jgi:cell division protein ZapA (FtsZ GTPase activity inhibitor)